MNMDIEILDDVLESLLFVSGDSLKVSDICELLEVQKSEVNAAVKRLQKQYLQGWKILWQKQNPR